MDEFVSSKTDTSLDMVDCKNASSEEEEYIYEESLKNLGDLKIGWKPNGVMSEFGALGRLYDMPGKRWFPKVRPLETTKFTTEEEWRKIRGPFRHYTSFMLLLGPPGNLFYNIRVPMTVVFLITVANAIYGTMSETVNPDLPHWFAMGSGTSSFAMTSFLVSLLLGFKINRSFDRWWLARQNYSTVCSRVTGLLTSISLAWLEGPITEQDQIEKIQKIQKLLMALPYALIMALYSLRKCPGQIRELLDNEEIQWIETTEDAWFFLYCKIEVLLSGVETKRASDMQKEVNQIRVEANSLLTIKRTHFPYFLTKTPTALLMVYTFVVPMELFGNVMEYIHDIPELQGQTVKNILHYWYLACLVLVFASLVLAANESADLLEDPYYYIPIYNIAESEIERAVKLINLLDPEHGLHFPHTHREKGWDDTEDHFERLKRKNPWFFR